MEIALFDWDVHNLRKIRKHRIARQEVEQALRNNPIAIYLQEVAGEQRFVYYGETDHGRLLAVIFTERADKIRVITAYDLDASQKRDYFERKLKGE